MPCLYRMPVFEGGERAIDYYGARAGNVQRCASIGTVLTCQWMLCVRDTP
jgi:hypothetical protein